MTPGPDDDGLERYQHVRRGLMPAGQRLRPTHRALRLIMTATSVAAGLCLVIGLVMLVAATGGGKAPKPVGTQATGGHRPPRMVGPRPEASPHPTAVPSGALHHSGHAWLMPDSRSRKPGQVVVSFSGHKTAETALFTITRPGIWHLAWSYSCRNGQAGDFVLGETRSWIGLAVAVDANGTSDHGSYWVMDDTGPHSLVVVSNCLWRLQVALLARRA